MSGVMKWIHFLASSSLRCQRTLCYQHRWSVHGSGEEPGANYKQVPVNTNESLRTRPVLSNDSFGSSIKMRESQWSCPIKRTVKTLESQFGSHASHRGLAATFLWERSRRRHSPISHIFFLPFFRKSKRSGSSELTQTRVHFSESTGRKLI